MTIKSKLKLSSADGYPEDLHCPSCGNSNLHHADVTVWRRKEDDQRGDNVHIPADYSKAPVTFQGQGYNPSSRRGAVAISFVCEQCDVRADLVITQHKGSTYLEWEDTEDLTPPEKAKRWAWQLC